MSAQPHENILLAKATQGKRQREARVVTAVRGLRHGLARAAEDLWTLAVTCSGIEQEVLAQEDALDRVEADSLILVLSAPGDVHALAVLDRPVLAGLIEVQTLGAVYDGAIDPRPYTTTDAAMAWLYLDRALDLFARSLEDRAMAGQLMGYRLEEPVADPRTAGLWLAPGDYQMFTAALDLSHGKRRGSLRLILPHRDVPPAATERKPTGGQGLDKGFVLLPLALDVVIPGLSLPLSKACRLTAGDFLPLAPDVLERAELRGAGQHLVAEGKLGQWNGQRALKLTSANLPEPETLSAGGDPTAQPAEDPGFAAPSAAAPAFDMPMDLDAGPEPGLPALPAMEDEAEDTGVADFAAALADDGEDIGFDAAGMADLDALEAMIAED